MSSANALVDAVIESKEGLSAVLEAAWDYGCAKQDSAICAVVDAIAKGKTDCWRFLEEWHLVVVQLAVFQFNMVGATRDAIVRMLCCVANINATNGELACAGKLPNVVAMQSDFHGNRKKLKR